MTATQQKTTSEVVESLLEKDAQFAREWERTALARAVAIRVIEYRADHGISQAELGQRLGMHQPAIARLEEGDHNPSMVMLRRLSQKLGIDLHINIRSGDVDVERLDKVIAS